MDYYVGKLDFRMGIGNSDIPPSSSHKRPRIIHRLSKYNGDLYDQIVSKLPQISGVLYDKRLKRWKTVIPINKRVVGYFSIRRYGFKKSWLKALYFSYSFIIDYYMKGIKNINDDSNFKIPGRIELNSKFGHIYDTKVDENKLLEHLSSPLGQSLNLCGETNKNHIYNTSIELNESDLSLNNGIHTKKCDPNAEPIGEVEYIVNNESNILPTNGDSLSYSTQFYVQPLINNKKRDLITEANTDILSRRDGDIDGSLSRVESNGNLSGELDIWDMELRDLNNHEKQYLYNGDDKSASSDDEDTWSFRNKLYCKRKHNEIDINTLFPIEYEKEALMKIGDNQDSSTEDLQDRYRKVVELMSLHDENEDTVDALRNDIEKNTSPTPSKYAALVAASKNSDISEYNEENQDPKDIANSLRPWHQSIFWIPSISRWRTLYYDEYSVRHTKTFTPAVFGGVRAAYYAAIEFRNMIDNMEGLTSLARIRRQWIKTGLEQNGPKLYKTKKRNV